ncbi:MAG: hypothetical protein FJZ16_03670 [Candidatus Omnitrophica bacterium]|nr:hypothetical protein [Candidatus Omnitrophota bacterium]
MRPISFPYIIHKGLPHPIIPIEVHGSTGWNNIEVYVDSGAWISIFTSKEADVLGINYSNGRQILTVVGDGSLIPVYLHKLPVRIGDVSFKAMVGFSPKLGVGFNLLGRKDFFAHFDVTFSDSAKTITFFPKI